MRRAGGAHLPRCRPSRSARRTMIRRLGRRPRSGCGACGGASRRGNCGLGAPARRRCLGSRPSDCKLLKVAILLASRVVDASREPYWLAERELSSELHYSGVSRRGLLSKAIRLGLYTCVLYICIYTYIYTGTGRHRAQITHFFRGQIGSWRSLGVGLVVGSRLYSIRHRCGSLLLSGSPGSQTSAKAAKTSWPAERNRPKMLEAAARAV